MRSGLGRQLLVAAGIAGALTMVVFGVLIWSLLAYRDSASDIRRSDDAIAAATEFQNLILDLETGQRGFVITGNPDFLEPWENARRALPAVTDEFVAIEAAQDDEAEARELQALALAYLRGYSEEIVELARTDRAAARSRVVTGEGKAHVDAMRSGFDEFVTAERAEADELRARADRRGEIAIAVGVAGLVGSALVVVLLFAYLRRAVLRPVQELSFATRRLAAGDLAARVPERDRTDELAELGGAFNAMAESLEESREELETQNEELGAQQDELETAVDDLGRERDLVLALHRYTARLTEETEVEALAVAVLVSLADVARADAGAVYATTGERDLRLVSSHGVAPDRLEPFLDLDGDGSPALPDVEQQLVLPLAQGERVLGVALLGRRDGSAFVEGERDVLTAMASQAAVALSDTLALRFARREASVSRAVLDATPDGICLTDVEGEVLLANAPMLELTEALAFPPGRTVHERLLGIADRMVDPDAYRAGMREIMREPDGEFRQEYTLADGRSFLGYVGPVRDSTGTLGGRVFVLRETTSERQAERLKDELVATVSHELRTPLTSIIGYLELVRSEEAEPLGDEQRHFLDIVDRNARRLLDVVGDLLFVAQVEAGRLHLDLAPVDLAVLVAEAAETARPLAESKGIELETEAEPGLVAAGDRVRLAQLLANLVSNAIKFTPGGGRVRLRATGEGRTAVLQVGDTGIGIPIEEQGQLFQRFFRSSAASKQAIPGTGLGLVICKAIAEAHGGSISFESAPDRGTTFRVEIPASARAAKEVHTV
jgi:signal transduction histidine kinase/CHASE3 domain sensor protein